jgi:hypothetical protein
MSRVLETTDEFLHHLLAHCQTLVERYRSVPTFLLEYPIAACSPETAAQFTAYTLTHWNLLCLSEKLEKAVRSSGSISKIVGVITLHVWQLGTVRAQALGLASFAQATEVEKVSATVAGDLLRAVLVDVGETLLAPALVRYVQSAAGCPPIFWVVDRRLPSPLIHLEQTAQILRQGVDARRLDPHYAELADGVLALVRRGGEYGRSGPGTLAAYVSSLSPSAFVTFIAQLYAESSAGNELWHDDPAAIMQAALRLVYRSQPNQSR